jgi:CRP-like cAMP-binding protein
MVQKFPLFSGISQADCTNIVSAAHEKKFSRRETLFAEGDSIRQILLLVSGWVKVTQFGQNGSEVILRLNGPGEIVGALGLCAQGEHCSTAQTIQPSIALSWDCAAFDSISERYPVLRRNTAQILEERLRELEQRFREVSTEKVAPRLSSQLVRLSNQLGKSVNDCVQIRLSREELAQLTGTSLFTVSRLLCKWELQGFVSAHREVVMVRNIPALMQLSEGR